MLLTSMALVGAAAAAGPVAAQAVGDKSSITLDPASAYIFVQTGKLPQPTLLIREPTADDIAVYEAKKAKAFAKAKRRWQGALAEWTRQQQLYLKSGSSKPGKKPVEPTERSFAFSPIELDLTVLIGPLSRFSKAGDQSSYLTKVPAGRYTVYGPVLVDPSTGITGTCLCMGTVSFQADAGAVTNLGRIGNTFLDLVAESKRNGSDRPDDLFDLGEGKTTVQIAPAASDEAPDPRIGTFPVRRAQYRPAGKLPNWYGVGIDRLTEMPGVFRYERDKMIDLTIASGGK